MFVIEFKLIGTVSVNFINFIFSGQFVKWSKQHISGITNYIPAVMSDEE